MSIKQPHLEFRTSGYYWRRRVPAAAKNRFKPEFFCFPLRTHVLRDAAELARRLTAVSEFCFYAEQNMSPEIMTEFLIAYAKGEIELDDRLRALSGPRTRVAAETAMALEAAARASLRDAIFRCDRSPAIQPLRDTAARLGVALDETEEDFAILADKMVRTMIAVSEEKEQRARGNFKEEDPYLAEALRRTSALSMPMRSATSQPVFVVPQGAEIAPAEAIPAAIPEDKIDRSETNISEPSSSTAKVSNGAAQCSNPEHPIASKGSALGQSRSEADIFYARPGLNVSINRSLMMPARGLGDTDPTIIELWDQWFDEKSRGLRLNGAYLFEDQEKADRFKKDADTIESTRKIIPHIFGETRLSKVTGAMWAKYNDFLRQIPNNHGRSSKQRHLTYPEFIEYEKEAEKKRLAKAEQQIKKERLTDEEADALRSKAKTSFLAPRTFQRHQKYLSAPLDYAVEKGLISHNPFKPFVLGEATIKDMRASLPETKRKLWTSSELAALLSTDKWSSSKTQIDAPLFWVPLIARLHGLRSEEILQLKPENVRCDDGIHFFDIERGTGQSAKSENARRFVPIHSQLIELGFLQLVERQKTLGKNRIFSRVSRSKCSRFTYTKHFTKNFTYHRKSRGVYRERQDLHSMRTTFNTKCVGLSVPDTARRYLMGHRNDDVGIINYLPEGFPLSTLKSYIEREQLDLSMVKRRFSASHEPAKRPRLAAQNGVAVSA